MRLIIDHVDSIWFDGEPERPLWGFMEEWLLELKRK